MHHVSIYFVRVAICTHQVEDLTRFYEVIEPVHDFFDRCVEVPPVHVKYVDVISRVIRFYVNI